MVCQILVKITFERPAVTRAIEDLHFCYFFAKIFHVLTLTTKITTILVVKDFGAIEKNNVKSSSLKFLAKKSGSSTEHKWQCEQLQSVK